MPSTALDIGSYSIKAISAHPGLKPKIEKVVEIFNPEGLALPNDDAQMEKLANLLKNLFTDHKLSGNDVRLALPESVISSKIINMPHLSDAELASAIPWQAEQYIPIPPEELALEYKVLFRPEKKSEEQMRVLLIGARKNLLNNFISVFNYLGIEPTVLETQTLSLVRSLQFTATDPSTFIIHLGANSLLLTVVHQGELSLIFNHMSGSQILNRALEQNLGLSKEQAEQYKRQYGLNPQEFQGKVAAALQPALKVLLEAIQKAIRFFASQHPQNSIQRVVLSGGGAQLPGLIEYMSSQLASETLIASPFASCSGNIPEGNHAAMSICIGLLNREL